MRMSALSVGFTEMGSNARRGFGDDALASSKPAPPLSFFGTSAEPNSLESSQNKTPQNVITICERTAWFSAGFQAQIFIVLFCDML